MKIDTVVIIMNKINYIYKYDKLKYGIFIDSVLDRVQPKMSPTI